MTKQLPAKWHVNRWDDNGAVSLQIELGAGYAVLLTVSPNGRSISMWHANGEHEFGDAEYSPEAFSRCLDEMVAEQDGTEFTPPPPGQTGPADGPRRSFFE
jgi:hypothetical protein